MDDADFDFDIEFDDGMVSITTERDGVHYSLNIPAEKLIICATCGVASKAETIDLTNADNALAGISSFLKTVGA